MATLQATRSSAAARLDRLPITSIHRQIMWIVAVVFFFELGDLNTFAFAAPAVMKEWNLSVSTISHIVSWTFFGMFIGAVTGGWFSDRLGRKKALLLTTAWYSGFSLLNAAVQGTIGLSATRLLTGVGLSAMTVIGMTYVSEIFPGEAARRLSGLDHDDRARRAFPVTAYVARFTIPLASWGWRLVFIWGALGLIILFFANRLVESPRWYENQGSLPKRMRCWSGSKRMRARNSANCRRRVECGSKQPPLRGKYTDLFAPAYLPRTIMLVTVWIAQTLGFYGFTAWVPTLLVAHGFSLVHSLAWSSAMTIGAVPGALIAALISDRWERKWSITIVALVIAVLRPDVRD